MRRAKRTTSISDLVQTLARRSWDDDLADDDRILYEAACVTIQQLEQRTIRLAQAIERIEAGR
jgi:RNA polymerase-interacting CarD/CdnL/TRCF family regulator